MPIYEYKCPNCDKVVELYFKTKPDQNPICRVCKSLMEKQISTTSNIIFHGSGFYCNDYNDKS